MRIWVIEHRAIGRGKWIVDSDFSPFLLKSVAFKQLPYLNSDQSVEYRAVPYVREEAGND